MMRSATPELSVISCLTMSSFSRGGAPP